MENKIILSEAFVNLFIRSYFKDKRNGENLEIDKLKYMICDSQEEKNNMLKDTISEAMDTIKMSKYQLLSSFYIADKKDKGQLKFDDWILFFTKKFFDYVVVFDDVLYWEKLEDEAGDKIIKMNDVIVNEHSILDNIKVDLYIYTGLKKMGVVKNDIINTKQYWKFIELSKPIKLLFDLSELFYQLDRLDIFSELLREVTEEQTEALNTSATTEQKAIAPEPKKSIIIKPDIIEKLYHEIKPYFDGQESDLMKVLQGEVLGEKLVFNGQQNQFGELFHALLKNKKLIETNKTNIANWIVSAFTYKKNGKESGFNHRILRSQIGSGHEIVKDGKRICDDVDWIERE